MWVPFWNAKRVRRWKMTDKKIWYRSKTFWVSLIGMVAILIQSQTGFVIGAGEQAGIIICINLILRGLTNTGLKLKN